MFFQYTISNKCTIGAGCYDMLQIMRKTNLIEDKCNKE